LLDLFAYDAEGPIPRLTTHPNVLKVARFPIKMPKLPDVQKGQPVFMTIKMYFGQTEIKIEAHIRDRKFTFTSTFETMEMELSQLNNQVNTLSIKPDETDYGYGYTANTSSTNVSNQYSSRPPSIPSRDHAYSNGRNTREDDGFYDGDSKHSSGMNGERKKIFGIKFGKRR
jgi:hypothetical protein